MVISAYALKLTKEAGAPDKDVDDNEGIVTKYLVYTHR